MVILNKAWWIGMAINAVLLGALFGIYKLASWIIKIFKKVFDKGFPLPYKEKEKAD